MKKGGLTRGAYHYVVSMRYVPSVTDLRADRCAQELNNYEPGNLIPPGVYTLDDVKKYGQEKGVCPYFTIRRMVSRVHSATLLRLIIRNEVAFPRRYDILLPLSSGSKGRRAGVR